VVRISAHINITRSGAVKERSLLKYTILGFQQEKLIENKLSIEDAFILRTIKDMYSSATMEFKDFDGIKYMWINYTYLLEQIPIVGSKRNLKRKIELYGKEFLLLRELEKVRKGQRGNFSYISPTAKLDGLQDYDLMTKTPNPMDKNAPPLGQNRPRVRTESPNKDTSISDTSIKDTKKQYRDNVSLMDTEYEKLTEKYGVQNTTTMIDKLEAYKLSSGKTYKSDYGAINSWVAEKVMSVKQVDKPSEKGRIEWR